MKFGRRLEQDLVPDFKSHYLQYKLLKKKIKQLEEESSGSNMAHSNIDESANGLLANQQITYQEFAFPGPKAHRYTILSTFKPLLDQEVEKIDTFVLSKVRELENQVLQILRTQAPWKDKMARGIFGRRDQNIIREGASFLTQLEEDASAIGDTLIKLDKFIRQNLIAIQKIIKKFDKRLKFDVAPWLNAQLLDNVGFLKVNLDSIVIALSDAYEVMAGFKNEYETLKKSIERAKNSNINDESFDESEGKKDISAQSFERKTTKYWVRSENLMAIQIAILKNLPVYLFDRKDDPSSREHLKTQSKNFMASFDQQYGGMRESAAITSIYLDNDDMNVYETRIKREEGAQLYRLRWYGDAKSLPDKEYVFMERKTHHESWVNDKSVKERFPIKTKNVEDYLEGNFDAVESMKRWKKPDSKGICLIKSDKELHKAEVLADECQKEILRRKLKPAVRTLYRRTAFQAKDNNEVRISIDNQLTLVNEKVTASPSNPFPWCRDMINSDIPSHDVLLFPYCILEVKLNTDSPPAWITSLTENADWLTECHKFSKFLTGIAYHHYEKIKELPHWFDNQVAIDPRNRFLSPEEKEKLAYDDVAISFHENEEYKSFESLKSPAQSGENNSLETLEYKKDVVVDVESEDEYNEESPLLKNGNVDEIHANQSPHAGISAVAKAKTLFGKVRRRLVKKDEGPPAPSQRALKPIRSVNRVKIEPKTSFANERTLIQWISAASLMITLATLIMTSGSEFGLKAGFVFFPLAFIIMVYAIIRYQYRAWAFRNRTSVYHDDLIGPVVLVVALAAAMGLILYLTYYYSSPLPDASPVVSSDGMCSKISLDSDPEYFAHSNVFNDIEGTTWIVGPFALTRYLKNGESNRFVFPNWKLSSVTKPSCQSDLVFLGMQAPKNQIAVWNQRTQNVTSLIDMSSFSGFNVSMKALSMVTGASIRGYDPGRHFLLMASNDGSVLSFLLPKELNVCRDFSSVAKSSSDEPLINDRLISVQESELSKQTVNLVDMVPYPKLSHGLVDDPVFKEITSMYFDDEESLLYILFGRSRILRSFNFSTGRTDMEWYLPGTSFDWSGFALSRGVKADSTSMEVFLTQSVISDGGLRSWRNPSGAGRGYDGDFGGVWKFRWDRYQFPSCANVFEGDLVDKLIGKFKLK